VTTASSDKQTLVLVVEDEILIAMLASDILTEGGYRVVEAYNADEALEILNHRHDVRVMFTDVNMPGSLDGYALARIVDMRWPGVGIIVTTAKDMPGRGDLPQNASFLSKPYSPAGLLAAVTAAIDPTAQPIVVHRIAMPDQKSVLPAHDAPVDLRPSDTASPLPVLPAGPRRAPTRERVRPPVWRSR
jgi:CheY-like chemotaxis protein